MIHPHDKEKLISAVVASLITSVFWWVSTRQQPLAPTPPPSVLASWAARVEALEARADAQAKIRCMSVTAGKLDMMIIPVENLGRKGP